MTSLKEKINLRNVLILLGVALVVLGLVQVLSPSASEAMGNFDIKMAGGKATPSGEGFTGTADSAWTNIFSKYRYFIVGVSGIGAISMVAFFIMNFMKLGASAGNPQARSQALVGVLWTGIAAAGLGAVALITGLFYNSIGTQATNPAPSS